MTEQPPNGEDAPAEEPAAEEPKAEADKPAAERPAPKARPAKAEGDETAPAAESPAPKANAAEAEGGEDAPAAESPAPKAEGGEAAPATERPARRGPPIAVAEEVLNERGEATAKLLAKVLGTMAVESGGRDDIPWARVEPKDLHAAAKKCRDGELKLDMLHLMLAVDWEDHLQMIYVLLATSTNRKVILRADIPAESPSIATLTDLWEAASWYERETHDLFGVDFEGNDDLAPLILYEGFEGYPGLKSFPLHDYQEF